MLRNTWTVLINNGDILRLPPQNNPQGTRNTHNELLHVNLSSVPAIIGWIGRILSESRTGHYPLLSNPAPNAGVLEMTRLRV